MMANVGFRIRKHFERVDPVIVKEFQGIATSNIGDVMGRLWSMDHTIKPIGQHGIHLIGSAFTVRTHPSDNLLVHKAMDMAQPGDVIVIDAFGDMGNAILGEIMCHYAKTKGIAGYIVDGPVRDIEGIAKMGFPVFAKGVSPRGPYKEGPGEINTTISCGNVPVEPGDLIIGDGDGVIVVPKEEAPFVLEKAKAHERQEAEIIQSIYDGKWDRSWVDDVLNKKGCEILD
jgi:regulator of RNase E activity RraA